MYDGAMIQSPSREALARARLSGSPEQFVEVLTQVTTIVASFMVGCHMPVKIKTLALPELWDTICGLKAGRAADKKLLQAKVFIFFLSVHLLGLIESFVLFRYCAIILTLDRLFFLLRNL